MSSGKKKARIGCLVLLLLILGGAGGFYLWETDQIKPTASGPAFFIRFSTPKTLNAVLLELKRKGVVRSTRAMRIYAIYTKAPSTIDTGTYQFRPGMTADEVLVAMRKPVRQMVRIPETNMSFRTANLLEKSNVLVKAEYKDLIKKPQMFKDEVSFPLPNDSLEGYLFPDTYDLPPMLGAKETIARQLKAFEKKVGPELKNRKDVKRILTIASMVELEAQHDADRARIAGVIENRIKRNMRLQIDATVLYGLQEWRGLTYADYRNTISPYNTYLHDGLPPGPICSPSLKSVKAALNPGKHDFIYYVAMPGGHHLFATSLEEHNRNVALRRKAMKAGA